MSINHMENELKIAIVGVGGGGSNMIQYFANYSENKNIDIYIANTDIQALKSSKIKNKIQLGKNLTKGLGAGMKPEIGKRSAEEEFEEIKGAFKEYNLVFLIAGLGGGTGTGAAPIIAKAIKDNGSLLISIVTKPFKFEGRKRAKYAEQGINELKELTDSLVIIVNDKILESIEKRVGQKEAFALVDRMLFKTLNGIINTLLHYHENDINVDFNDLKTVVSNKGNGIIGIGKGSRENAALKAIQNAVNSPFLEQIDIKKSGGILVNFIINEKYPLVEIEEAMNFLYEQINEDCNIIFGTTTNNNIKEDESEVVIVISEDVNINKKEKINVEKEIFGNVLKETFLSDENNTYESELDIPTILRRKSS